MINNVLVVCFYNRLNNKNVRSGNIFYILFCGKTVCNGYKSTFADY